MTTLTTQQQRLKHLYFKDMIMSDEAVPIMIQMQQNENMRIALKKANRHIYH